ncbi:predicted protein, partial [Nematostella vectensis]
YIIFQAHSLYRNNLVSKDAGFSHETTDFGQNAAVLLELPYMGQGVAYCPFYVKSNFTETYNLDVISVPYDDGVPFPGGCCLTCNMDVDPNIKLKYTSAKTTLTFSFANVFFRRNDKEPPCDGNTHPNMNPYHFRLKYDIYQMFLPEGDLSEDSLFSYMEKMAYPNVIKTYGTKVSSLQAPSLPLVSFDTLLGQGVIYNIIVHDPTTNKEAAYSPVHTYGCSFTSKIDGCKSIVSTVNKVFAVLGAAVGLVMCFCGHRLFKLSLFLGGLVNFGFIFFLILAEMTSITHLGLMLLSAGIGVFFGLAVFTLWWFTEYTRCCLLTNALFLGFICAGCVLFSPLGESDIWQSDFDYGMVIVCITVVIPFLLLPWPKVLSIVYTSTLSAYGVILGMDVFLHTSLSYILLNIVIRAIETDYSNVIVRRPFQTNDIVLACCWGFLALCGIASQFYTNRNRLDFPKSGY